MSSVVTFGREVRPSAIRAWLRLQNVQVVGAIAVAVGAVLLTGLLTPQPMIGDEVTHYYVVTHQAETLPHPTVEARIPHATGYVESRYYPHVFLWHYAGAVIFRLCGDSPLALQVYHTLFWLQLLAVCWLIARHVTPAGNGATLYLLAVASLPMGLLFAVAFYQDIPAAAQVLTCTFLLLKRRWALAAVFLGLALAIKISVLPFIPAFAVLCFVFQQKDRSIPAALARTAGALALVGLLCLPMMWALNRMGWSYYPAHMASSALRGMGIQVSLDFFDTMPGKTPTSDQPPGQVTHAPPPRPLNPPMATGSDAERQVANHPGDVRNPINILIYGGLIAPVFVLAAIVVCLVRWRRVEGWPVPWATVVGGWLLAVTAYQLRNAPDARFFLPGILFVLLSAAVGVARLPFARLSMPVILVAALVQGGVVLHKTYALRRISPELRETIAFLDAHRPAPPRVFMYPEGNYRLFPLDHDWYLNWELRQFWKSDNSERILMLQTNRIGAIVIKKHLIGRLDPDMNNLGIYPDFFVHQIETDARFRKIFDNPYASVFACPAPSRADKDPRRPDVGP